MSPLNSKYSLLLVSTHLPHLAQMRVTQKRHSWNPNQRCYLLYLRIQFLWFPPRSNHYLFPILQLHVLPSRVHCRVVCQKEVIILLYWTWKLELTQSLLVCLYCFRIKKTAFYVSLIDQFVLIEIHVFPCHQVSFFIIIWIQNLWLDFFLLPQGPD